MSLLQFLKSDGNESLTMRTGKVALSKVPKFKTKPGAAATGGAMQINNKASKVLGVAEGDRVGIESIPSMADLGFLPYVDAEGNACFPVIFRATKEQGTSKLAAIGSNFDFSASNSWSRLGGNPEGAQEYKLSEAIFGVAETKDGKAVIISNDTPADLQVNMVIFWDSDIRQFNSEENITTVGDVLKRGQCCFYLSYEGFVAKAARLEAKKDAQAGPTDVEVAETVVPQVSDGSLNPEDEDDF